MSFFSDKIQLASGGSHTLGEVSDQLGLLETYMHRESDRVMVSDLRLVCLGNEITAERQQTLLDHQLLEKDGTVAKIVKDIVLASVRGEDTDIFLVSPFTKAWDRTRHEFFRSRSAIRLMLPKEQAEAIISSKDWLDEGLKSYAKAYPGEVAQAREEVKKKKWGDAVQGKRAESPRLPDLPEKYLWPTVLVQPELEGRVVGVSG